MKIKRAKSTEKCVIKRRLKYENYKNYLEATKLENKIKNLDKEKINIDSLEKNHKEFIRNNKSILKTQQRFKREGHNVFTEEINKIALGSSDDKGMQSIYSIETYAYGRSKDVASEKEEIKCNNVIKIQKMINFDDVIKENKKEYNPSWPQIPDYSYRTLIIGSSGSGKTNSLFNLINQPLDIDKKFLYAKDPCEAKY